MIINLLRYLNHSLTLALIIFVSLGYTATLLFPSTILVWDAFFILAALIGFTVIYLLEGNPLSQSSRFSNQSLLLGVLPIMVFALPFYNIFQSVEAQFSRHGDLYGAYVNEILFRTGEPSNVYVFGSVANYPWLYQAFIASLSHIFQIPPPFARSVIAVYVILSCFGWVLEVLSLVLRGKYSPLVLSCLACFVLLGINLFGFIHSMIDLWDNFHWANIFSLLAPETFVEAPRLQNGVLGKFIQYTTTGLGFMYAWVSIYAALRFVKKHEAFPALFWFGIGFAGSTAFLLAGGFYIPGLLICGYLFLVGLSYIVETNADGYHFIPKLTRRELLYLVLIWTMVAIQAYNFWSSRSANSDTIGFELLNPINLTMIFGNYYPLLPFLGLLAALAWFEKNPLYLFLLGACLVALAVTATVRIRNEPYAGNEYKLILFASFLFTLSAATAMERLEISFKDKSENLRTIALIKPISVLVFCCVAINGLGVSSRIYEIYERWEAQRGYYYEGSDVLSRMNPYQDIYTWLRTETDTKTVLLMPLDRSFDTYVLSERMPYVSLTDFGLGDSSPLYAGHIQNLERIYSENPDSPLWQESLDNILAILGDSGLALIVPLDSALVTADLAAHGFTLAYTGNLAAVYLYNAP